VVAIVTGRRFVQGRWADYEPDRVLRGMVLGTTILIFCQLAVAASMRHQHAGLSIPDFPAAYGRWWPDTSADAIARINAARAAQGQPLTNAFQIWLQMVHRGIALLIFLSVCAVFYRANFVGAHARSSRFWSLVWVAGILCQIGLGAWTIWSNKAADIATSHVALGALMLVLGVTFTFRLFWGGRAGNFILPNDNGTGLMSRVA
jgi:heme a synthase